MIIKQEYYQNDSCIIDRSSSILYVTLYNTSLEIILLAGFCVAFFSSYSILRRSKLYKLLLFCINSTYYI